MKKITLFMLPSCPHCRRAIAWMEQLKSDNPSYSALDIEQIDESQCVELSDSYDYYYVPTFYVDGTKLHEGVATIDAVRAVLDAALH